jgi:hypothetical protein
VDGEAESSMSIAFLRYRANCPWRIRRKTATPEATFLFFSFTFLPFYHKCNPCPLLGNYNRGGTPQKETWDILPFSKACNPYYEHSSAWQHEQQQNTLDVGLNQYKPLCPPCIPSGPRRVDTNLLVLVSRVVLDTNSWHAR